MNALLVVPWDEERGGVISVVHNLAKHLRAAGHGVIFFHGDRTAFVRRTVTKLGFEGVRLRFSMPFGPGLQGVLRTLVFPLAFIPVLVQVVWLLRSRHIHIVNLHYPVDNFVYFALCRYLLPIRLVTSIHGRDAFHQERPKSRYSIVFRVVMQSSDLIVLPSEAYRSKFLEAFPGLEHRTIFIHNGVDIEQFTPGEGERETRGRGRYILCVAELREYKAVDVLLRAAQRLLADDSSLTLVLVGDGPLRGELEGLASSLGIHHRTTFLGTQGAKRCGTAVARLRNARAPITDGTVRDRPKRSSWIRFHSAFSRPMCPWGPC